MINLEKEVIEPSKKGLVVMDFYADWCNPCRTIGPILDKFAKEYKVKLIKVNMETNQELASKFGIMSIPTVIFFKNEKHLDFFVGAYPEDKIKDFFEKYK